MNVDRPLRVTTEAGNDVAVTEALPPTLEGVTGTGSTLCLV